jgi:HEAT repeat protein
VFFLIEQVIAFVLALLVVITLAVVAMVVVAVQRRQVRERYFDRLDRARQEYGPILEGILNGSVDYRRGLARFRSLSGRDRLHILERLFLNGETPAEQLPTLRRLCEDLGLVALWQQHLASQPNGSTGRWFSLSGLVGRLGRFEFLSRAQSAENLGQISHQPSWPMLVRALKDPHPDVQSVAVHALALIGEPKSFPALVERLHAVVLEPTTELSLRTVKTALVSFPLSQAPALLPSLQHSHRRLRFLATDIIREMVEREASSRADFTLDASRFAVELAETFLTRLCVDQNPDVRARAAPVLAYIDDPRATRALLSQLEDAQWFVRLHAARALAKPKFASQVDVIAERLTDRHWMVREAAVQTLHRLQRLDHLCEGFLRTQDRYGQEQIADEWQRAGVIPALLSQYVGPDGGLESRVLGQLISMGKTSYMLAVLQGSGDRELRKKFLQEFGRSPDPQIQYWVGELAARETDAELRVLAQAAKLPATDLRRI